MIRGIYISLAAFAAVVALLYVQGAFGGPLDETRYCVETPSRNADGSIARSSEVLDAFKRIHPCPATGAATGRCDGWNIDHVIPLAVGGCDSVSNLQWLPVEIKRCPGKFCKDRWERVIYKRTPHLSNK